MDVLSLADAVIALECSESTVDIIAARFIDEVTVTWSAVHGAGIPGRDIVRLRRHMAGVVCVIDCWSVCCRHCHCADDVTAAGSYYFVMCQAVPSCTVGMLL